MAVRQERAHLEGLGQRYGLLVGRFGGLNLQGGTLPRHLTAEPQGVRLIALLLAATGVRQGTPGELMRVLEATGQEIRFAKMGDPERIGSSHTVSGGNPCHGLLEQWQGLGEASNQRIGVSQAGSYVG
jgi:hypothetical protein